MFGTERAMFGPGRAMFEPGRAMFGPERAMFGYGRAILLMMCNFRDLRCDFSNFGATFVILVRFRAVEVRL